MKDTYYSFNDYLKNRFGCKVYRIPLNTGLTCPNKINVNSGCIFCDEFGSGAGFYPKEINSVPEQVKYGLKLFSEKRKAELFYVYFQSFTNTYGNVSDLKKLYDSALIDERIKGIIIGTRPDCVNRDNLELIESYGKKFGYDVWLELGLQSSNNETLKWMRRGHTVEDYVSAMKLCKNFDKIGRAHV